MPRNQGSWRRIAVVGLGIALVVIGFFLRYPMPEVGIAAEPILHVGSFAVTNSLFSTWLAMIVGAVFFWAATRRMNLVPTPLQNIAEMIVEAFLGLCTSVAGERNGRRFFPLVTTIFIFALFADWMGLLPGYGTVLVRTTASEGEKWVPLFRAGTSDLNTTLALAIVSFVVTQVYSVRELGVGSYLGKFINFREGPIGFFVGVLELISEVARIISFSFRLFGNIFAGEVLLTVLAFLVPFVATIPFLGLEVFVGAVQAFIFAMLTLVFLTMATTAHERPHEEVAVAATASQ